MEPWYYNLLALFLAERWSLFEAFCEERGDDPEEVYRELKCQGGGGDD